MKLSHVILNILFYQYKNRLKKYIYIKYIYLYRILILFIMVAPAVVKLPHEGLVLCSSSRDRGQRRQPKWLANSTTTWVQLRLKDPEDFYYLTVAASYNQSVSPVARLPRFTPYEHSTYQLTVQTKPSEFTLTLRLFFSCGKPSLVLQWSPWSDVATVSTSASRCRWPTAAPAWTTSTSC